MSQGKESKRILVVEDDEAIQLVVKEMLEAEGFAISVASNGAEALVQLDEEGLSDLILLDMKMPIMDGWQFAAEFDVKYGRSVPIIVMTAAGDAIKRAGEIHAAGCLGKPFSLDELDAIIRRYLR